MVDDSYAEAYCSKCYNGIIMRDEYDENIFFCSFCKRLIIIKVFKK